MDIFRPYIWLTQQPLRRSLTIVLLGGLVVAVVIPLLPPSVQQYIVEWVEGELPFLAD